MFIEFIGKFYDNHSLSIVNRNIILQLVKLGIDIRIIPLDSYDPLYALDKSEVRVLKSLEKLNEDVIPDVQIRHSYPPIWSWPVSEHTKIIYIQPWEYSKALFEWQYKFETFADALIVPSNYCKNVFSNGGLRPDNLFVVPNGYDDKVFNTEPGGSVNKFGINPDKVNFVYVGNSQWRKGLDILINAWSKAFSRSDNAKLIIKDNPRIYGQSNLLSEIIKIQYQTDCGEIIYIDDELSSTEMSDIYKASKVLVHPYRAEGFGMHIQEAMACGCVPIISAEGPTEDFIPKDKGFRIPVANVPVNIEDNHLFALKPGDATTMMSTHTFIKEPNPEYLLKAMKYIYHSHDRETILVKARFTETRNTWEAVAKQYLDIFTSIASRTANRLK
jgi:glycosyltransferase involved in cell wall biosynthesis